MVEKLLNPCNILFNVALGYLFLCHKAPGSPVKCKNYSVHFCIILLHALNVYTCPLGCCVADQCARKHRINAQPETSVKLYCNCDFALRSMDEKPHGNRGVNSEN